MDGFQITLVLSFFCLIGCRSEEEGSSTPTTSTTTDTPKTTTTPIPDRPDLNDICSRNDHLTDPRFTCCAAKRYDAPKIYNNLNDDCFKGGEGDEKIVTLAWQAFKCLVDKELNGPLTMDKLADILMAPLSDELKNGIKTRIKDLTEKEYDPYKGKVFKTLDGQDMDESPLKGYEDYAKFWNTYYYAENWACIDIGNHTTRFEMSDEWQPCYSWINQAARRGDCCRQAPLPFQLYPDPIVDKYFNLKNWTAVNLMTIPANDFNSENTSIVSWSNNVALCLRTAMFIQQGFLNQSELTKDITEKKLPNYSKIADDLIPNFIRGGVRKAIYEYVFNETAIELDDDIMKLNNTKVSMYQNIYADEWIGRRYNENVTRTLFWHCRTHNILLKLYRDAPIYEHCY